MFTGFTEKTTEFLWGIRLNNNRQWLQDNKQSYLEDLQQPMNKLADTVWLEMTSRHKLEVNCHVSRIYRDARRAHKGGLYKDRLWFSLRRPDVDWMGKPVFFFEITPEGYSYGMGYYSASPETMKHFRERLDKNPKEFLRIASALEEQKEFILYGEEYKRKKAEMAGILEKWYNLRNMGMIAEKSGHEELYSARIIGTLCEGFSELLPLYHFLWSLDQ